MQVEENENASESSNSNNSNLTINNSETISKLQNGILGLCCLLRIIQFCFIVLLIYGSVILIKTLFFIPQIRSTTPKTNLLIEGAPEIPFVDRTSLNTQFSTLKLLDLNNFTILQLPSPKLCSQDNSLFTIIVHSKPDHFKQRQVVRSTWGGLHLFSDKKDGLWWSTRTLFVLGKVNEEDEFQPYIRPNINDLIKDENRRYGDIIQGSFSDLYHNLRYKHILGLKHASEHCSNSIFFLKADDDAFIDIIGLYQYLVRTFGALNNKMKNILAGNVFPSGTKPQREGKWTVSIAEYPWNEYPSYLGGLSYLASPDVARDLCKVAHLNVAPQIWVDDVWVTGLLAQTLNIQPLYMNSRYSYDHSEMKQWLERRKANQNQTQPPPFTFAHLDPTKSDWKKLTNELWKKVLLYYDIEISKETYKNSVQSPETLKGITS